MMPARRTDLLRREGPFWVTSLVNGTLVVYPAWAFCGRWEVEEGGGPGIFTRMELALEVQAFLNGRSKKEELAWFSKHEKIVRRQLTPKMMAKRYPKLPPKEVTP